MMSSIYSKDYVDQNYEHAKKAYAALGVDADTVLETMKKIQISLHCWQGDDVGGFEEAGTAGAGGGTLTTGNYPGKARNGSELRQDLEKALSLIPGKHRVNVHALYAETDGKYIDRDQLSFEHFGKWVDWAKQQGIALDFNPSFFSHKMAASGLTLSSKDSEIRNFWIRHGKKCREIAAAIGKELGSPCVNNIWVPDGSKDVPADRLGYRKILADSLDEMLSEKYSKEYLVDAVESKLFGIGCESFTVGSHEFYMGYGLSRGVMPCFDMGHFHLTESVADKVSATLLFTEKLLLHVSRPVRWDSDHVVIFNDDLLALSQEVKRCNAFDKVYFALDFFDASINRITAWVTGTRATLKSILVALLEPTDLLVAEENKGNFGNRLALMEEFKALPFGAVWNKYCQEQGTFTGAEWLESIAEYERNVLSGREKKG
jgi:L-rhamnose isomerase